MREPAGGERCAGAVAGRGRDDVHMDVHDGDAGVAVLLLHERQLDELRGADRGERVLRDGDEGGGPGRGQHPGAPRGEGVRRAGQRRGAHGQRPVLRAGGERGLQPPLRH